MRSFRKSLPAFAGLLFTGALVVGVTPAFAAAPYPDGGQATALVSGAPLVQATCTTTPVSSSGVSTLGTVTVTGPAGAQCASSASAANGEYAITGATAPAPTGLRFSAQCININGATNGLVDVPAGTTVSGLGVVSSVTTVSTNVTVTYPGGTTAVLNSVSTTATSVTRIAIQVTGGAASGTVVGRAVCGSPAPYPLAVSAPGASADVALTAVSADSGSSSSRMLFVGGAIALLIVAQVAVGRSMWRRRQDPAGS